MIKNKMFINSALALLFFVCVVSTGFAFTKDYPSGQFAEVVNKILKKPLGYGQALAWQLDYNGAAVFIPGNLLIFDYSCDKPVVDNGKELERSLLTGVIEPE
jgi:hypothetical protein